MQRRWTRAVAWFCLAVAVVGYHRQAVAQARPSRKPVPDEAAEERALTLLREVYGPEIDAAKAPAEKTALATKLLDQTAQARGAELFVLLGKARDLATQAGDAKTVAGCVKRLAQAFEIDALEAQADALDKVAEVARFTSQRKLLALEASKLVEEAMAADAFEIAERLSGIAMEAARSARDGLMVRKITARQKDVQTLKQAYAPVAAAQTVLDEQPTEPSANRTVGSYRCVWKGDWDRGVAMLALGDDPAIKEFAVKELLGPGSAAEKVALADGWWALGETKEGRTQNAFYARAGHWYREALPELGDGLAKMRVEKRMADVTRAEAALAGDSSAPASAPADEPPEWETVGPSGMLTRCYTLGPFPESVPDAAVVSFISKVQPGQKHMGQKMVPAEATVVANGARFTGPDEPGTKMYYVFMIRTDRNQKVQMQAETFGAPNNNSVDMLVDYVLVKSTAAPLLRRGIHVVIVKQIHKRAGGQGHSWITLSVRGEHEIEQKVPSAVTAAG